MIALIAYCVFGFLFGLLIIFLTRYAEHHSSYYLSRDRQTLFNDLMLSLAKILSGEIKNTWFVIALLFVTTLCWPVLFLDFAFIHMSWQFSLLKVLGKRLVNLRRGTHWLVGQLLDFSEYIARKTGDEEGLRRIRRLQKKLRKLREKLAKESAPDEPKNE